MKQIKNLAWMSAIALAGTITFAACSSDDDKVQNINPTYDGNSVKTQFAINVPRASKQTRQTAEITQNNSIFRGMEEIILVPMTTTPTKDAPGAPAQDLIELADYPGFDGSSTNYKLYNDVNIKVGVNHFLFYGQATGTAAAASSIEDKLTNGVLTKTIDNANNANTTMSLEKIHATTLTNTALLGYLNSIVSANTNWTGDDNSSHMGILYNNFIGLTAGSANSILKAVEKLYNSVAPLAGDNNSDKTSQAGISYDIKEKIEQLFKVASSTSNNVTTYTLSYKDEEADANKIFPTNLGLPEGAARLTFANGAFSYVTTALGGNNAINVGTICYPAALNYFASTPVKVTDSEMISWPSTATGWTSYAWTGWTDKVLPTTRTIALKDNINYGVALLKTTLKTAATLADNSASQGGATADKVISNDGSSAKFKLTGVLVGGQPSAAKWNFLPASTATFENTIWDGKMNGTINVNTTQSTENYTMVLDNNKDDEMQKVNIAVELQNNTGEEFYGIDGVVPAGGKFYLVAQLDPASTTHGEVSGSSNVVNRVFLKDYTTTANLTINSLQNAYVTIPDLRSTKLQLGLSVDLEWQAGLTFNVTIQ